jgi:hypothetical protein
MLGSDHWRRNRERERMQWPWPDPRKGDLFAVILAVGFAAIFFLFATLFPNLAQTWNSGFGPEWDCTAVGKGEPVCIKRPLAGSEKPARRAK